MTGKQSTPVIIRFTQGKEKLLNSLYGQLFFFNMEAHFSQEESWYQFKRSVASINRYKSFTRYKYQIGRGTDFNMVNFFAYICIFKFIVHCYIWCILGRTSGRFTCDCVRECVWRIRNYFSSFRYNDF